jgi:hypothetical protein
MTAARAFGVVANAGQGSNLIGFLVPVFSPPRAGVGRLGTDWWIRRIVHVGAGRCSAGKK